MTEQSVPPGDFALNPAASEAFNRNSSRCFDGRITGRGTHPMACGGHADIWKGQLENRGVAVKVLRPWSSNGKRLQQAKLLKRLWREYLAWSSLSHPNVIELLGFSYDFSPDWFVFPSLVSPWMSNGTVDSYIEDNKSVNCVKLLIGIAEGMSYLHAHEPPIVHGDLRAGNVLVSDSGDPCLSDFGLSRILNDNKQTPTSSDPAGSLRWMAPELFHDDSSVSVHSDVWAFGMTVLEVVTGERPWSAVKNDAFVLGKITDGVTPARPEGDRVRSEFNDELWAMCRECWSLQPTQRPSMGYIVKILCTCPRDVRRPETQSSSSWRLTSVSGFTEQRSFLGLGDYTVPIVPPPITQSFVPDIQHDIEMERSTSNSKPSWISHGSSGGRLEGLVELLGIPPLEPSARTRMAKFFGGFMGSHSLPPVIQLYDALDSATAFPFKDECKQLHTRCVELLLDLQDMHASVDGDAVRRAGAIIEDFSSKMRTWFSWKQPNSEHFSVLIHKELQNMNEEVSRCVHSFKPEPYWSMDLRMRTSSAGEDTGSFGGFAALGDHFEIDPLLDLLEYGPPRNTPPVDSIKANPWPRSLQKAFDVDDIVCLDGHVIASNFPQPPGRSAEVRRGRFINQAVAIKTIRTPIAKTQQRECLERLWFRYKRSSSLSHPNILSYLGFYYDSEFSQESPVFPSLVLPWMTNGTLPSYLERYPSVDRFDLIQGVARGLAYLHSQIPSIIHGDLRAENILVSDIGVPCLNALRLSEVLSLEGVNTIDSLRWMSPELLRDDTEAGRSSDVWAYGMTVLEVMSGKYPYEEVKSPAAILRHIRGGNIPSRPASTLLHDDLWDLCRQCWNVDVLSRPDMQTVTSNLDRMAQPGAILRSDAVQIQ